MVLLKLMLGVFSFEIKLFEIHIYWCIYNGWYGFQGHQFGNLKLSDIFFNVCTFTHM